MFWLLNLTQSVCVSSSFSHGRSHRPPHVRRILSQIPSDPLFPHLKRHNNNNSGKSFPSSLSVTDPEFTTAPQENSTSRQKSSINLQTSCWSWSYCRRHCYCLRDTQWKTWRENVLMSAAAPHRGGAPPEEVRGRGHELQVGGQTSAVLRSTTYVLLSIVVLSY